jgi:polar amino acid transport system permease protein
MDYEFQFNVIWQNWRLFVLGAWLTIQITSLATALGLVIGIIMAGLQLLKNRTISAIIQVYIEIIRNTPFLVQLFFVFFGLPTLGIKLPAGQAALIALTINIGAYATEIVRAGVESISKGQIEAGRSLGLSGLQIFIYIILKPALMTVYPALTSQFILIMLNSAVISVISAQELAYQAKFLQSRTFRSFEIYFFVTFVYLLLAYLFRSAFGLISRVAFGKVPVN